MVSAKHKMYICDLIKFNLNVLSNAVNFSPFHRCSEEEPIRITVPTSSPADWLVCGLLASPRHGLQRVTSTRVKTRTDAHLTLKSPPTDLTEGEQFQIHLAVRSTLPTPLEVYHGSESDRQTSWRISCRCGEIVKNSEPRFSFCLFVKQQIEKVGYTVLN